MHTLQSASTHPVEKCSKILEDCFVKFISKQFNINLYHRIAGTVFGLFWNFESSCWGLITGFWFIPDIVYFEYNLLICSYLFKSSQWQRKIIWSRWYWLEGTNCRFAWITGIEHRFPVFVEIDDRDGIDFVATLLLFLEILLVDFSQ